MKKGVKVGDLVKANFELFNLNEAWDGMGSERFPQPTLDDFLAPISFKIYNVHFS